jgi:hypothetical protein
MGFHLRREFAFDRFGRSLRRGRRAGRGLLRHYRVGPPLREAKSSPPRADPRPEAQANAVKEPELERQGRVLGHSGWRFLLVGVIAALPGAALVVFTDGWAMAIGIVILALSGCPVVVGIGLLLSSLVARWSARHRLFA